MRRTERNSTGTYRVYPSVPHLSRSAISNFTLYIRTCRLKKIQGKKKRDIIAKEKDAASYKEMLRLAAQNNQLQQQEEQLPEEPLPIFAPKKTDIPIIF